LDTTGHLDPGEGDHLEPELARIEVLAPISIIVPTYREVDNIPLLIERVAQLRNTRLGEVELIFMDDQSRDGSAEAVAACGHHWVRLVERAGERGLSRAVLDGFALARHPVLACMDCDLSHPPERLPQMILALSSGQQFVIGSRYVPGGSTDDDWGFFRWLNSRIATLLARPLTKVGDPMSGYFVLRRSDFLKARDLNPIGYKIALELIVKCGFENVGEVPIRFSDRVHGESKLNLREQVRYLVHLRRLYLHRFANVMYLAQFLAVGLSGVAVNMAVITAMLAMGAQSQWAITAGIAVSVVTNFLLNRRITFSYARDRRMDLQFLGFVGASAIGMMVNYLVSMQMLRMLPADEVRSVYLASLVGVASGTIFNFLGNRYVVFRKRFLRK